MKPERSDSILIGLFFVIAMAGSLIGAGMIEPVLTAPDMFAASAGKKAILLTGILLELINAISVIGIAVYFAPSLRQFNLKMAYGYLAFRTIEAISCCLMVLAPLILLIFPGNHSRFEPATAEAVIQTAIVLRSAISSLLVPVFFCLGAFILYLALYQTGLLPRFIAIWGLAAVSLIFAANIISLYINLDMTVNMVMALPIILNEIFMGFWLLFKGFNTVQSHPLTG